MNAELHLAFKPRDAAATAWLDRYRKRASATRRTTVVTHGARPSLAPPDGRTWRVLCASDGEPWSTDELVAHWREQEARGTQTAQFLIGGPDGWPGEAAAAARWAFGRITMAHQLAAVVLAEQVYRATTVLARHPYHSGHEARA